VYAIRTHAVRDAPGMSAAGVGNAGEYVGGSVIDGPVENDGYVWWKLQYNGAPDSDDLTGWVMEMALIPADFAYPATGYLSSDWDDDRSWGPHHAVDIANEAGTPVRAARDGVVRVADYEEYYGNHVTIDHESGYSTTYCHFEDLWVAEGDRVSLGEQLGEMGSTGNSTGPHVHFEVRHDGQPVRVPGTVGTDVREGTGVPKNYDGIRSL
jgi:murein DD-endopeptidase MepM/ murein hydrolase activator NlpD